MDMKRIASNLKYCEIQNAVNNRAFVQINKSVGSMLFDEGNISLFSEGLDRTTVFIDTLEKKKALLECIFLEIERQKKEQNSKIYSVYVHFRQVLGKISRSVDIVELFLCWIYLLVQPTDIDLADLDFIVENDECIGQWNADAMWDDLQPLKLQGVVIDLCKIMQQPVTYFRKANVFGSRVTACNPTTALKYNADFEPPTALNIFLNQRTSTTIAKTRLYRRECKFVKDINHQQFQRRYASAVKTHNEKVDGTDPYQYVSSNYFFRVSCPSDPVMHGLPLCYCFHLKTYTNRNRPDEQVREHPLQKSVPYGLTACVFGDESPFDSKPLYIPMTHFVSTSVLLFAMDKNNKFFLRANKRAKFCNIKIVKYFANFINGNTIDRFVLIDLHPQRMVFRYVEENNNRYNCFDNDY